MELFLVAKQFGDGAHIIIPKKYLGITIKVVLPDDIAYEVRKLVKCKHDAVTSTEVSPDEKKESTLA